MPPTTVTTERPLVIAHRGASADAPENTIAAFELALTQGAEGLELGVHLSRDG
ncbi:MAG TPA: glycerophosphodiester phosphodiesterase family protein, partial [Candidatus Bathyarchaeia archaeon]|nr:glycerophosphodiester phosphodiesterase family protein [Candidatus Bathyarchaeia archaeon]